MTTSARLHRRTCAFERQDVGIYDTYRGRDLNALACRTAPYWPPGSVIAVRVDAKLDIRADL